MSEAESHGSSWLSFFKKPFWTILSSITGIIGFVFALVVHFGGSDSRELTFSINPTKLEIVNIHQASNLTVSYGGKSIQSDVTVAQVALWNNGAIPIKKDDLLRPPVIFTEPSVSILQATILKTSRDVIQLSLDTHELQQGRIQVNWEILEKRDGGVIEIIYAGSPDISFDVDGTIIGQNNIAQFANKIGYESPAEQYETLRAMNKRGRVLYPILALLSVAGFIFVITKMIRDKKERPSFERIGMVVLAILLLIFSAMTVFMFSLSYYPSPPLGL